MVNRTFWNSMQPNKNFASFSPLSLKFKSKLVHATQVNSVFCALWLAIQSRDSSCYSPSSEAAVASRELWPINPEINSGAGYSLSWYVQKQIFSSVSVNGNGYLPRHEYLPLIKLNLRMVFNLQGKKDHWQFYRAHSSGTALESSYAACNRYLSLTVKSALISTF